MANGRVITGYSHPFVALYSATGTTVSYTSGMSLARGVDVSITPNLGDDNGFYADNQRAESSGGGLFVDGTFSMTVDGLKDAAEKLIYGLPTAGSDGWTAYDDSMKVPYVGVGFVVRFQEDGATTYMPYVLPKAKFDMRNVAAKTQEENVDYQTQSLEGNIFRSDNSGHAWMWKGTVVDDEVDAIEALETFLGA